MKKILLVFAGLVVAIVAVFGVRGMINSRRPIIVFSDMDFQPRYRPQGDSNFFADGQAQRTPVKGTVAFGGSDYFSDSGAPKQNPDFLQADSKFYQGKEEDGSWVKNAPLEKVNMPLLRQGKKQYEVYCRVCHGGVGDGNGIMKEYGFAEIASLIDDRIQTMPDGQIYHTIVNGKGLMKGYGFSIKPKDRWPIVLYVRALQKSQNASLDEVPEPFRSDLQEKE